MTIYNTCCPTGSACPTVCPKTGATGSSNSAMTNIESSQEDFLKNASLKAIVVRGIKKLITELTSVKTLFIAFLCVLGWYNKISDTWLIIGGLATLGVKEIPSDVFGKLIDKFGGK